MIHLPRRMTAHLVLFLVVGAFSQTGTCCPYSIRDTGFIVLKRTPYRVFCFVNNQMPKKDALVSALDAAAPVLLDTNVTAEVVNVDEDKQHEAIRCLEAVSPESQFPVVVLVSPDDRVMTLPNRDWRAATKKKVQSALEKIVSSPKREELKQNLVERWCVAVLVEGRNAAENEKAEATAEEAIEEITGATTEMGRTVESGPCLVAVPNDADEKIFLWSLGLDDVSDHPRMVVLYGRGRPLGGVLEGSGITKDALLELFRFLGTNCSCATDPEWLSGMLVPLKWDSYLQTEVRVKLGFDPDSPRVLMDVASLRRESSNMPANLQTSLNYSEGYVEFTDDAPAAPIPAAPVSSASVPSVPTVVMPPPKTESAPSLEKRTGYMVFAMVGGMAVAVAVAMGVLGLHRLRRS